MFTRVPSDYRQDRRRPLTILLLVLAAIYLLLTAAGTLWTDFLWFESLGYRGVWLRNWSLSLLLGSIGIVVAFLVLWLSLRLVDRLSPRWAPFDLTEEEELIERFREWIEPRVRQVRILVTASLAVILGLTVATWRDDVFLFMAGETFGVDEPIFLLDVGFYMFRLPLLENAVDWLFNLMVLATVLVAVAHYLNGGIRFDGRRVSTTRAAKIHLSVMFALVSLVRAASYRLDMYELLFANNAEKFFGPGFTDISARLPALRLLFFIAVFAAALFIVNIFRRGWTLAAVSVGAWIVVAILAGSVYPAIVQRFNVLPNQLPKESPYISHNLAATKAAYGLDRIEVRPFEAADDLTAGDIEGNRLTIDNLRIWTTAVLPKTYQNFQELEPYYALSMVDTDRYLDEGSPKQVMVAVRELEEQVLPTDWQNTRLFYTHGYGAVVNQANVVQPDGQPVFLLKDVPPVASVPALELEEPRVYFGETYQPGRPVIVRTGSEPQEIDLPLPDGVQYNEYDGNAGVVLDSIWKRIAFAFRYRDLNLLISGEVRSDSRVLVERNVRRRVDSVTPFLESDVDPYPVIIDGRIKWVVDLYTHSTYYPYSQPVDVAAWDRLAESSGITRGTNYLRNSVKAVVDAHDGELSYYLFDPDDPIARAWAETYPGLLQDASAMPQGLDNHLRYPQDLFRIQSHIYLIYHVNTANQLFSEDDAWSFPGDPSTISRPEPLNGDSTTIAGVITDPLAQILPYYLLTELPGEDDLSYLLLQPFNPRAKQNMVGFLVADSTPGRFGRLIDFRMPQGELVDGTQQAGQRIEQDAEISQQLSLWRGEGSDVIKGDLLVVPIEDSLLYLQPIFLEEAGGSFPEFRRVAVVYADQVEWADSIDGALALIFGEGVDGDPSPPPDADGDLSQLVSDANAAFQRANAALRAGDLAEYQRWVEEAARILEQIEELLRAEPDAAGSVYPY
jgi:uncharacterized membrane protein (UPF0182 family)